jgi:hypothetical protein
MRLHVQIPDGVVLPIEFPSDLTAGVLLRELIADEKLHIEPRDPLHWRLQDENIGQTLDSNKTLEQNGVASDHRLLVQKHGKERPADPESGSEASSSAMKRCDNGHYFDPKKHTKCPFCGVASLDLGGARSLKVLAPESGGGYTVPVGGGIRPPLKPPLGDDAITQPLRLGRDTIDPVVGWLVCVHGPEKGKDYRIRSENNTLGRSSDMYICISGDEAISRERHATITFDPRKSAFHVIPGTGRGVVYLNGDALLAHKELVPYDEISLGKTKLIFVPFCGEKFKWE